jgi:hypothetical protein
MRTLLITTLWWAAVLPAADFGGTWLGRIPTTHSDGTLEGAFQEVAFKFVQKGTMLDGKLFGDYQGSPISEGKISGNEIDFIVVAPEQQGNSMVETRLHFIGSITKDGEIELTRVRESSRNAGNGGTYKYKAENSKQTFHLKRLL